MRPGIESVAVDPPVIDPSLDTHSIHVSVRVRGLGAFPTSVAANAIQPVRVGLYRGETEVLVLAEVREILPGGAVSATWDGTLGGKAAPRGAYSIGVRYGCDPTPLPSAARQVSVLRVGVATVAIGDGDGARIPMLWHKLGHVPYSYWLPSNDRAVFVRGGGMGAAALGDDGAATRMPELATDLETPPVDTAGDPVESAYNLPFALRVGTRPDLLVGFGLDAGGDAAPRIRARVTDAHADDAVVSDGGVLSYRLDAPPAPRVGRYDVPLRVRFEAERADHSWVEFGGETAALRAYGVLGDQTISTDHDEPYAPWLAVVDAVAGWAAKSTADPHALAGIIVHHVNEDLGLRYDTTNGASFYTLYSTATGYSNAAFDMTAFLDRMHGSTVNCSDCASIVSTYANMVGCDLGYTILTRSFGFRLNYIRAIGTAAFTNDPFHRGATGGFNYHAITSPISDGTDVFDATLVEDGDDHPEAAPFTDDTPDGLARSFYLSHLSPVHVTVTHADKTTIE